MTSVLIVEDEAQVADAMRRWLEPDARAVRRVASAEEALDAMAQEQAAVAVCDVGLPGHDGLWLAAQLHERYPETAIVLATGAAQVPGSVSLRRGCVAYLLKPFGPRQLRRAVTEGVEWYAQQTGLPRSPERLELEARERRQSLHLALGRIEVLDDVQAVSALETLYADSVLVDHTRLVADLAGRVAARLSVDATGLGALRLAALAHEVGTLTVPRVVLGKPGPLTEDERLFIERAPVEARVALQRHARLAPAGELIHAMREQYAGGGYPRALSGEDIPLGSRILAVADALDTMTRPRPYREPLSPDMATAELLRCAGTQFDPDVVHAALSSD